MPVLRPMKLLYRFMVFLNLGRQVELAHDDPVGALFNGVHLGGDWREHFSHFLNDVRNNS